MAAKVVMVAVPTVLGIASIRVYTVSEVPADGLVTREKLNIYTPPPPQSAQLQFVPEKPGVIESGLTTARESVVPFVQGVKGACVSVKRGSVNLYRAGEDVFFYLKDPPPGFLPRFGTITMAGLLGMVLARKGSRFKQLAVPLGLMSAGASVCYPAQAVAVFKVTGKKAYAAGQWSSAAVSSLLTSKPQEPIGKDVIVPQPQISSGSTTVSSAQSTTVPELESAESVPVADEPIVYTEEEESSVTLAPTESDAVVNLLQPESTTKTSSELPAFAESEEPSPRSPQASSKSVPSLEEPPAPEASDTSAGPVVESAEAEPVDQPPVAAAQETPTSSPPPSEGSAGLKSKGGSGFKPNSSLMDFGQSSPEDEDLYSTRS